LRNQHSLPHPSPPIKGLDWKFGGVHQQDCQMVYFQTKNLILGNFGGPCNVGIFYGHLVYSTAIWYTLWTYGIFVVIWYIFPRFGMLYREKSGNPVHQTNLVAWDVSETEKDFVLQLKCRNEIHTYIHKYAY
jgi:hypothetical protein